MRLLIMRLAINTYTVLSLDEVASVYLSVRAFAAVVVERACACTGIQGRHVRGIPAYEIRHPSESQLRPAVRCWRRFPESEADLPECASDGSRSKEADLLRQEAPSRSSPDDRRITLTAVAGALVARLTKDRLNTFSQKHLFAMSVPLSLFSFY